MLHKKELHRAHPGSRKLARIQENLGAAGVDLSDEEFFRIEAEFAMIRVLCYVAYAMDGKTFNAPASRLNPG